jgi:Uma2 family endonuclease
MVQAVRSEPYYTASEYFGLVERGIIRPDDRVELLEGVIVAMSPQNPPHASAVSLAHEALREAIGRRAVVRVQSPLLVGTHSVPEPDVALVPGNARDYSHVHPSTALLVVEVADTSLLQDRLTKAAMYAVAGIAEYWLVNLPDDCVEVFRYPDQAARQYTERSIVRRGSRIHLVAFPDASVAVDDLLPDPS